MEDLVKDQVHFLCALSRPFCCWTKPCLLCDAATSQGSGSQSWAACSEHRSYLLFQNDKLVKHGEKSLSWGEERVEVSNYMQVIGKKFWQFFCWDIEVLQKQDNTYFLTLSLSLGSPFRDTSQLSTRTYVVWLRKWKVWRRVTGGIQTKKSYLDNAIVLRQMKLHLPAPDRWVEILRLY